MALRIPSLRIWPVLSVGGAAGLLVANRFGVGGGGAVFIASLTAALAYLIWCAFFALVRCWACGAENFLTDGMGGMTERPCWRCKRRRLIRRPGAVLIGAHGRRRSAE